MLVAVILLLVVVGSVAFNVLSPWWFTDIASNWSGIDLTVMVTFWICGVAFVLIGGFMCYSIWKFKYREDARSEYKPENPQLEKWLTAITTIGVVVMLAPGLVVWEQYTSVPPDATEIEVMSEQWKWSFRLPGEDGILGTARNKNIAFNNPFGMNTLENNELRNEYGDDDFIITGNEIHLPINRKVKILLRSKDVLHNFWVPQIRAKMDAVPGMVTYFWFESTRIGRYEILCAELCGLSHHAMRGWLVIDTQEDYEKWLDAQVTWSKYQAGVKPESPEVTAGRLVAEANGCFACHSIDGGQVVGPTWQGLWGRQVKLQDGSTVIANENYVRKSITDPMAQLVEGFTPSMITYDLTEKDMKSLLTYLKATSGTSGNEEE